eukprot:1946091-Prorocentrum_lima.AAC.1
MTSSLVGSEMCIRDRDDCFRYKITPKTKDQNDDPWSKSGVWKGGIPVSYTHLTLPTICSV